MRIVKYSLNILFLSCLLVASPFVLAADTDTLANAEIAKLKQRLAIMFPEGENYTVTETPVPGLFQVDFADSFVYITADGQYAVKGDIINMRTNVNITDKKRAQGRLKSLSAITEKDVITYPAKNKKISMTVFTDIDCGYCRRLHSDMNGYNEQGIEVRYAFYPRAGLGSNSHQKATSVWCADDQRKALDTIKGGSKIETRNCDTPIVKHMEVANKLGISSTPTLMFDDGTVLPGYIPPARLALILKQRRMIP